MSAAKNIHGLVKVVCGECDFPFAVFMQPGTPTGEVSGTLNRNLCCPCCQAKWQLEVEGVMLAKQLNKPKAVPAR